MESTKKFPTAEELIDLHKKQIETFEEKSKKLSEELKCKVTFEFFEEVEFVDNEWKQTGKLYVAYIQDTNILTKARAMDLILLNKNIEAGLNLAKVQFLESHSSQEISSSDEMKLGLYLKLAKNVDIQFPALKKS